MSGIRTLYVGDRPADAAELATDAIEVGEFSVCLAPTADEAVAWLHRARFDCLVFEGAHPSPRLLAVARGASELPVVCRTPSGDETAVPDGVTTCVAGDAAALARAVRRVASAIDGDDDADSDGDAGGDDADDADGDAADASGDAASADAGDRTGGDGTANDGTADDGIADDGVADDANDTDEPELWHHHWFHDTVLDSLWDIFFVFDTDRRLVDWNVRLEEATGYGEEELAGMDPLSLLADEEREDAVTRLIEVLTTGRADAEFHIPSPEGGRVPYEFTASLITDEDGTPQYVCGIGRDVSELRQKQAELERKQAELEAVLEELERSNAELEQFAYTASHDLKEPLRMVTSYLDLLERRHGDELDGDAQEFLAFARDGGQRMRRMVDQLLEFSRIGRADGAFEYVDCEAVLAAVIHNLEVTIAEHDAQVRVGDLPTVTGHHDRLVQLFQNLVANAITHAGEGPPVVEVEATRLDGEGAASTTGQPTASPAWEIAVSDNGVGIPAERRERVFDIFYSGSADSTGIGLAIAQKIVESHGGDIRVESVVGEGSTFYVTLPDAPAEGALTRGGVRTADATGDGPTTTDGPARTDEPPSPDEPSEGEPDTGGGNQSKSDDERTADRTPPEWASDRRFGR